MRKAERASIVQEILEEYYPETPVPLDHQDNFTLLVAVLLSAQCTDERVNQVTPFLFSLANNPKKMSKLSKDDIYKIIKPCGLGPKKSKAILNLSKILVKDHQSCVPESFEALESLPGVGHKTASVVMSQGFGHPAFPVDTHIHRLAQRWGLTNGRRVTQTERDLKRLFPISPMLSIWTPVRWKFSISSLTKTVGFMSSVGKSVSLSCLAKSKNSFKRRFISSTSFSKGSRCSSGRNDSPNFNLVKGVLKS